MQLSSQTCILFTPLRFFQNLYSLLYLSESRTILLLLFYFITQWNISWCWDTFKWGDDLGALRFIARSHLNIRSCSKIRWIDFLWRWGDMLYKITKAVICTKLEMAGEEKEIHSLTCDSFQLGIKANNTTFKWFIFKRFKSPLFANISTIHTATDCICRHWIHER